MTDGVNRADNIAGRYMGEDTPPDDDGSEKREESAAEKLMCYMEREMLQGRSRERIRQWVVDDLGVPDATFSTMYGVIKQSWKQTMSFEAFCEARDINRARYLDIYTRAMHKDQFLTALRAIDCMVRLDGLEQPAQLELSMKNPGQGITNSARDQVSQLVERMKQLAASRMESDELVERAVDVAEGKVIDVNDDGEIEGHYPNGNGTNGHGYPTHLELHESKKKNGGD